MISYTNDYTVYKTYTAREPEWAKAERLAYCEKRIAARNETALKDSLRTFFGRIFR